MNSRTTTKMRVNLVMFAPADPWASTFAASGPARRKLSPGGAPAWEKPARIPPTTFLEAVLLFEVDASTVTRASAAWPSFDAPRSLTAVTFGTCRATCSTRSTAARSAAVSGPESREATMIAVAEGFLAGKGAASAASWELGLEGGSTWTLLDCVTPG